MESELGKCLVPHEHHYSQYDFITCGYRKNPMTTYDCLRSIFKIHNETINIWSHLLGFFYLSGLLITATSLNVLPSYKAVIMLYLVAACYCMLASTIFHTFNVCSLNTARCVYKCDLFGVSCVFSATFGAGSYLGFENQGSIYQAVYIVITCVIACIGLVLPTMNKFTEGDKSFFRTLYFGASSMFGFVVYTHWLLFVSSEEREIVQFKMIASMLCFITAFAFYTTNFPERFFPRIFDILGQSHQTWHIAMLMGAILVYQVLVEYSQWLTIHSRD